MRRSRKILIGVIALILILAIAIIALNSYVKSEIKEGLDKEFPKSGLDYSDISVNIIGGNATIKDPVFKIKGVTIAANDFKLNGFSYSGYFFRNEIKIGHIELISPQVTVDQSDTLEKNKENEPVERTINLKKFSSTGGSLNLIKNDTASSSLFMSFNEIVFLDILMGKEIDGDLLPFKFKTLEVEVDSIYYNMNKEHYITVGELKYFESDLQIKHFKITPKFAKPDFDRQLPFEKDWVALDINEVKMKKFSWGKENETLLLRSPSTSINQAIAEIYRNKLLPDDERIKPMYSEMIRELGVKIKFDTIKVTSSKLTYLEKVNEERPPGELRFNDINATIDNITNLNMNNEDFSKTNISATSLFMNQSQLTLNLNFDIRNQMDEFHVSGNLAEITSEKINSFLIPAMNIEAEGRIESMAYNFYGNRNEATGNMQMSYRDFKVNILKKGENEKKSLLSSLANLLIKNDSVNEDVEQEEINTKRDKTKSFWNFLWLCIRDGTLKTFL